MFNTFHPCIVLYYLFILCGSHRCASTASIASARIRSTERNICIRHLRALHGVMRCAVISLSVRQRSWIPPIACSFSSAAWVPCGERSSCILTWKMISRLRTKRTNASAGQWARKLCMSEALEFGSILPYVARAKAEVYLQQMISFNAVLIRPQGYAVVVLNPNMNDVVVKRRATVSNCEEDLTTDNTPRKGSKRKRESGADANSTPDEDAVEYEDKIPIPFNENGFKHVAYVWDKIITPSVRFGPRGTGSIGVIAHSFGGNHAISVMQDRKQDIFNARSKRRPSSIGAIAFIDSVHVVDERTPPHVRRLLQGKARHWVKSSLPLDTPLERQQQAYSSQEALGSKKRRSTTREADDQQYEDGCEHVSAGSDSHDHCPSACVDSVFRWLQQTMP